MAHLPTPGGDPGAWGDLLNEFLRVEHAEDGTHRIKSACVDVRSYGSFSDAIDDIGANKKTLLIPNQQNVTADKIVPANITLRFLQGGSLNISGGITVTINGDVEAGLYQIFHGDGNVIFYGIEAIHVTWFGADPTYHASESTNAFVKAFNSVTWRAPKVIIDPGQYDVRGTITVNNRVIVEGYGLRSSIYFRPPTDNAILFEDDPGGTDNVQFRNFNVYYHNPGGMSGGTAFNISSNASAYVWDRVFIEGFSKYGINLDRAMWLNIKECRFLGNSANGASPAIAINISDFANVATIERCRFAQNDRAISIPDSGASVHVTGNSFEGDGNNDPGATTDTLYFKNVKGLNIKGNYFEAIRTAAGRAIVACEDCISPVIEGNYFVGEMTGITYSDILIRIINSRYTLIQNNDLQEVLSYLIKATGYVVKAPNNRYRDDVADLTSYNDIMNKVDGASLVDIERCYEFTWNPGNLADGTGQTCANQAVTGAAPGDIVLVSAPYSLQGMLCTGYVVSAGNVAIRIQNESGTAVDLPEGTWRIRLIKPQ